MMKQLESRKSVHCHLCEHCLIFFSGRVMGAVEEETKQNCQQFGKFTDLSTVCRLLHTCSLSPPTPGALTSLKKKSGNDTFKA